MKLRNKKTGEIKDLDIRLLGTEPDRFVNSLAELNEEWEDYEEPKGYWYYDTTCGRVEKLNHNEDKEIDSSIGNCFETKEEAEKAVEKLKAWKRLKDECDIKFDGTIRDDSGMLKGVKLTYDRHTVTFDRMRECIGDLLLLFGGEE